MQPHYPQNNFIPPLAKFFQNYRINKAFKCVLRSPILILIRMYQYILSPFLPAACRFYPSCSEYAFQAIYRYGLLKGIYLSIKRILKCHPFHPGGIDPVP